MTCHSCYLQFKPGGGLGAGAVDLGASQPLLAVGGVARRALTDEASEILDELGGRGRRRTERQAPLVSSHACNGGSPCHLGKSSRRTGRAGPSREHVRTWRGSA